MTLENLYAELNSNFDEALARLQKRALMERLMKLFLKDPSMQELGEAIERQDAETAFRAVHTLKGVSLNLGFAPLAAASSTLTEILRGNHFGEGYREAYEALSAEYRNTVEKVAAFTETIA